MLQDLGIPVEAGHGRAGGYRLRPGFKLPPLLFTEEEAMAVTLGLLAARRVGLTGAAPATEGALAKIERVLPVAVGERIRALTETIGFSQAAPNAEPVAGESLLTLSAAAQQQRRVWLRYRAREGDESEREVDPYGLVFHYGRWYLVCFDHRSGEMRIFRVDRIQAVERRTESFERPPDFDSVEHLARSLANIPWGFTVEVVLEARLEEVRWRVPAHFATLEETPGGVLMRAQADDLGMAARYLVGLGWPFAVRQPLELRDEVRRLAVELLAHTSLTAKRRTRIGALHGLRRNPG
jgi:predicted DNA-binding transcriptional regulator YafY